MGAHNMDRYIRDGFEYKSLINRLVIDQTSATTYDLTLKPKFILLNIFSPSFAYVEIEAENGMPISSTFHYHYVLYAIAAIMIVAIFLFMLSDFWLYGYLHSIVWVILIVFFKIHGYRELRKINVKILSGEPVQ